MERRAYAEASQPEEPDVRRWPAKNSLSFGLAARTSASVRAAWAPESPDATETSAEKPELERSGSVIPYVSFPSATARWTWAQVTCSVSQPSRSTVAGRTPRATGEAMSGVSEVTRRAASGSRRR
ncbi:hypothetical protein SMICM17S_12204 [Streptomyces microflavus]